MRRVFLVCMLLLVLPTGVRAEVESLLALLVQPDGTSRHLPMILSGFSGVQPRPVVVIVPDEAGLDRRTGRLAESFAASGWIAVETDPDPVSLDGGAGAELTEPRELGRWLVALTELLGDDPRIDPHRIAVVGLGAGGRAALHAVLRPGPAPDMVRSSLTARAFVAHAALYPRCNMLAAEEARPPPAPTLLLLPGTEDAAVACGGLQSELLVVQLLSGAAYAWDLPADAAIDGRLQRALDGATSAQRDPATAEAAERLLLRFLRNAFGG